MKFDAAFPRPSARRSGGALGELLADHLLERDARTGIGPDVVDQVVGNAAQAAFGGLARAGAVLVEDVADAGHRDRPGQHDGADMRQYAAQLLERLDRADLPGGDTDLPAATPICPAATPICPAATPASATGLPSSTNGKPRFSMISLATLA